MGSNKTYQFSMPEIWKQENPDRIESFCSNFSALSGTPILLASKKLSEAISEEIYGYKLNNIYIPEEIIVSTDISFSINDIGVLSEEKTVSITYCECLIASTGTIVVSEKLHGETSCFILPEKHIVLAPAENIVENESEALNFMEKKYGNNMPGFISFITGPSRTADIEKTLVLGAHGPKYVTVLIISE